MKKISLILLLAVICFAANAQYKKASFLTKGGRTYEVGTQLHFLTNAHAVLPSINFAYGRDKPGKKAFHWFDLELLMPTKFHYSTTSTDAVPTPVTVNSKTGLTLNYRYNFAYYIVDKDKEDAKVFPFVTAGIGLSVAAKDYSVASVEPANKNPSMYPGSVANASLSGGAGVIIKANDWLGIKIVGGYNATLGAEDKNFFLPYKSHPYLSIGARFLVKEND